LPEAVFGIEAITGITEEQIAKRVWRQLESEQRPHRTITCSSVSAWVRMIDARFVARRKTW
jgi:hypothetical protein